MDESGAGMRGDRTAERSGFATVVDDYDLVVRCAPRGQRPQAAGERVGTIARGDDDRDLQP
jgi:hypothetical protein